MKFTTLKTIFFVIIISIFNINDASSIETILRVAFQPDTPPYQFIEDDINTGIHIELLNKIADENNFVIKYIAVETVLEGIRKLKDGDVDIMLGVNSNIDYDESIKLTENISESYISIFTKKDKFEDIEKNINQQYYSAGLEDGIIRYSYIQNMSKLRYYVTSNQIYAFDTLINNKVDLLIGVRDSVLYQMEKGGYNEEYVMLNNYLAPIQYAMAVNKNNKYLINKLNESIQKIRIRGDYDDIYSKWIYEDDYRTTELVKKISLYTIWGAVIVLIIFILNIKINIYLKKEINKKTKELRETNDDLQNQIIQTRNYNTLNNYIIENNPNAIIVFDRNLNINSCNNNAEKLMKSDKSLIGKNVTEFNLLKDIIENDKEELFSKDFNKTNQAFDYTDDDNEIINFKYSIYQLLKYDGEVRLIVLTIEDITNENKIKHQFYEQEKNKALNRIIASIAHEIRNPLMSIKIFVEQIPKKFEERLFREQLNYFVPKEVDRVNSLITNLIDYAKPISDVKENLNLYEIINSIYVLFQPYIKNENIQFNMDVQDNLQVASDENKLKQIIINLILNAFESVQEKLSTIKKDSPLKINIKAWKDKNDTIIEIFDEGMGMTEYEKNKSIELFYTTKPTGTGLGLSLSKQYVEERGGILLIESVKNKYAKVTLKL